VYEAACSPRQDWEINVQKVNKFGIVLMLGLAFGLAGGAVAEGFNADKSKVSFDALDMTKLEEQDALTDIKGVGPKRFAIGHELNVNPAGYGHWTSGPNGSMVWTFEIDTPDAAHLGFGFNPFHLPDGATLNIASPDGSEKLGTLTAENNNVTGQFWTQVLMSNKAVLTLTVPAGRQDDVQLELVKIGHGYRGFGARTKYCKSGSCNMDVACLGPNDPWNDPRRSVAAYTRGATDTCTGSLVNNTAGDRRLIFATAGHCGMNSNAVAATIVAYWNYESATCRTPGSAASGSPLPKPNTTYSGANFLANHGTTSSSDWTLLEFVQPLNPAFNHFWAGWDRTGTAPACAQPGDPASTAGMCASIHHPGVDEKRITFIGQPMDIRQYLQPAAGSGTSHWYVHWDPSPPLLPGIQPPPVSVVPNVTEGGSSGSPLYNVDRRLVGVLSGGLSGCGSTGEDLTDYYGRLAIAWEGGGTPTTAMKTHLDPVGGGTATVLDGINACTAPAAPTNVAATASAANAITVNWTPASGITRYQVLRSTGACPGSNFTQIAEVNNVSTYVDSTVSGGTTYSYKIVSVDTVQPCSSPASSCSSATATGQCTLSPTFNGATSASSPGTASCEVDLAWSAATPNCGAAPARYNVYRSTTPGFTPSAANLLQSCLTATTLADTTVGSNSYHYVVRAEDPTGIGSGLCAGGIEDTNLVYRSARPFGPGSVDGFTDNAESGITNWTVAGTGAGANWTVVTTQSHSPSSSFFVPDPATASTRTLTLAAPLDLTASGGDKLELWTRYSTEANYDGVLLEYSLNGGTTWTDILGAQGSVPADANRFTEGGYNAVMNANGVFGARTAWHGARTTWTRATVNLAAFSGNQVSLRFRFASDTSQGGDGFWIDDVRHYFGGTCTSGQPDLIFEDDFEL
jgi:hypothetical protein